MTCEARWSNAHELQFTRGFDSQGAAYLSLVLYCSHSAEERAGPDAGSCLMCDRRTIHQHAHECVICGHKPTPNVFSAS